MKLGLLVRIIALGELFRSTECKRRIAYGIFATEPQARNVPFMAQIRVLFKYENPRLGQNNCAGSIISSRAILSANHCFCRFKPGRDTMNYHVTVGSDKLFGPDDHRQVHYIKKVYAHAPRPNCEESLDVAIAELEHPMTFNDFVKPIKLQPMSPDSEYVMRMFGWGQTEHLVNADRLKKLYCLFQVNTQKCLPHFDDEDPNSLVNSAQYVCFETQLSQTLGELARLHRPCRGDSGGPVIIDSLSGEVQVGVFTVGDTSVACGEMPNHPNMGVRISYIFDWIAQTRDIIEFDPASMNRIIHDDL